MRNVFSLVTAVLVLSFSATVHAVNVGVLTIQGKEKFKFSGCGRSAVREDITIRLRQNGSWDNYNFATQAYVLNVGNYKGSLTSRKVVAYMGNTLQSAFINTLESAAEELCNSSDIDVLSYKPDPFYYKIKINKNRSKATMKAVFKLKGYDADHLKNGKGSYVYSGKGGYSIQALAN